MGANEAHANGVCGAGGPRASTFVFLSLSVGEIVAYFHRAAESMAEGESLVARESSYTSEIFFCPYKNVFPNLELLAFGSFNSALLKLSAGDKCEAFHPPQKT